MLRPYGRLPPLFLNLRHASLQYFTSSQFLAMLLRQVNGRPHAAQIFSGRCSFLTPRTIFLQQPGRVGADCRALV